MNRFLLAVLVLLAVPLAYAGDVYTGTCDGYIHYMNGNAFSGATVTVTVNGCSGDGCVGHYISESTGYYVIANLKLNSGGTVSVYANKSTATGVNTGIANPSGAARVNVTVCNPPTSPSLTPQADQHINSVSLSWTSGTDPWGYTQHDEFRLDLGTINTTANSPQSKSGLSYNILHTWRVWTCNDQCCSAPGSSTFTITNAAPPAPNLTAQADTHNTSVSLNWISYPDSESDTPVHNEFQFDSEAIINPATSPQAISGLVLGTDHTWRVRTCDSLGEAAGGCSAWVSDSFSITNEAPTAPILVHQPSTTLTNVSLNWTSGTDPEGDPVHDEFQFSHFYDFSTLLYSNTSATSPTIMTNLSNDSIYYWRVKTCDPERCSPWATDSFIVSLCPVCTITCSLLGNVSINITSEVSLSVKYNVNFGDGRVVGDNLSATLESNNTNAIGGTWSWPEQYIKIKNDGTVNEMVNVSASASAAAWIGGTAPDFEMIGWVTEANACNDSAYLNTYKEINTANASVALCKNLKSGTGKNEFNASVKLVVPSDALAGSRNVVLTFTAKKV